MKTFVLLLTFIVSISMSYGQSKKDLESDYAKCISAKDSLQDLYTELSKSHEALSKSFDSIQNVSLKYDTMYNVIKDKVIHDDFTTAKLSETIDSLKTARETEYTKVRSTLSDTIISLQNQNEELKAKIEAGGGQEDVVGSLKKLKELLDAGIITQEEFDAKKATMLEKL